MSTSQISIPFSTKARDWANNYDGEQAELTAAFDLVKPTGHWKNAISCRVDAGANLELIQEAVIHFTATVPTFTRCASGRILVKAAGYYAGPAGDC